MTQITRKRAAALPRPMETGGVGASLAAATGLLVGLRTIASFDLPRPSSLLGVEPIARESLGVLWSMRAIWPAELQAAALDSLVGLVMALVLAAVGVATLNAFILLAEAAASRRSELAVRSALGAGPGTLLRMLLAELRTLFAASVALGLVFGLAAGGTARALWPSVTVEIETVEFMGTVTLVLAALSVVVALAHLGTGLRIGRGPGAADALRSGGRVTSDAAAVFFRRAAPAVHTAVAGTLLVGAITLSSALPQDGESAAPGGKTVVVAGTAPGPGAWRDLLSSLEAVPDLVAESIASAGALLGLGVRDYVTAQCGPCVMGGLPMPFWGAIADHHAVTPDFFELVGIELLSGRLLNEDDRAGAEPVMIVNQTFARSSFYEGKPLGRKVKLGTSLDAWYTVVGVVADVRLPVLGADDIAREALYLSAFQQPPRTGHLVLRGDAAAVGTAHALMVAAGFRPDAPQALSEHRAREAKTLRWIRALAVGVALLALLLAAHGVHATALQVTRRRTRELAIRRVLGARDIRIVAHVLGERLRVGMWGVAGMLFWGTLLAALMRKAAGMPATGPTVYVAVGTVLLLVALAASVVAAREALGVEPGTVVE